jgi:transposase-like protein
MAIDMTALIFNNEDAARAHLESIRWPDGVFCPHCGEAEKVYRLHGESHRTGLIHCNSCNGSFTVTTGTVLESSHVALHKWVLAYRLMNSSKKGFSAHQLHRTIGVTYKTAWFMTHRIRESMRKDDLAPMGGGGSIIEADETFIGTRGGAVKGRGPSHKRAVLTLVERGGEARSFHIERATKEEIVPIVRENIKRETHLMTDEAGQYIRVGKEFANHSSVDHSREEYAYTDRVTGVTAGVNTAEGFFSIFKRGMTGVYQHCGEQHLHRYLAEFDFRYSNRIKLGIDDEERTTRAIRGGHGKRLTYKPSRSAQSLSTGPR